MVLCLYGKLLVRTLQAHSLSKSVLNQNPRRITLIRHAVSVVIASCLEGILGAYLIASPGAMVSLQFEATSTDLNAILKSNNLETCCLFYPFEETLRDFNGASNLKLQNHIVS